MTSLISEFTTSISKSLKRLSKPKYSMVSFIYNDKRISFLRGRDEIKVKTSDVENLRAALQPLKISYFLSGERRISSNKYSTFRIEPTDSEGDLVKLDSLTHLLPLHKKNGTFVSSSRLPNNRKINNDNIFHKFETRNNHPVPYIEERWTMPQHIKDQLKRWEEKKRRRRNRK